MSRVLRTDVFVDKVRFEAGTAESDLPEGVSIPNPAAWEGESEDNAPRITEPASTPGAVGESAGESGDDETEVTGTVAPVSKRRAAAARRRPSPVS